MLSLRDEKDLDRIVDNLNQVIRTLGERQGRLEGRLRTLYKVFFVTFGLLVFALSFLVIILARQLPQATLAMKAMNGDFYTITDDMTLMHRTIRAMDRNIGSVPAIISHIDRIQIDVGHLSGDISTMAASMETINFNLGWVTTGVADMRDSFTIMDQSVLRMGRDVNRMATPMRIFNSMVPFW